MKAVKIHLQRIVGAKVRKTEYVFMQIEAVVNSGPLGPISKDKRDLNVLTLAYFLILKDFRGCRI